MATNQDDECFDNATDDIIPILDWLFTTAEQKCKDNDDCWCINPENRAEIWYREPSYLRNMRWMRESLKERRNIYDWDFLGIYENFDEETTLFLSELMDESPHYLEKIRNMIRYMKKQKKIMKLQQVALGNLEI